MMKSGLRRRAHRGMTLIEMSIAIGLGMLISAMLMSVFNMQLFFLRTFREQTFLTEEAPMISTYVSKIIGQADRFSLHSSLADARDGVNQKLSNSPPLTVARLYYRQPDGSYRSAILSFEDRDSGKQLYYFVVPQGQGALAKPEWSITRAPKAVSFKVEEGILSMALTGPKDEMITYSGTMQQ